MDKPPLPLLSLYLMQVFQGWSAAIGALPYFLDNTIDLGPGFNNWPETLRGLNQQDQNTFIYYVHQEIAKCWEQFSKGILKYLSHQTIAERLKARCIWHKGTTKVWNYAPEAPNRPIVLIIPSLINKYYIFDLDKNCSFIQFLKDQGLSPWIIDWQSPGTEEATFSLSQYVQERILPILTYAYNYQQRKVSVLGYCMGGILSLAAAHSEKIQQQSLIDHLILIATPWDFKPTVFHKQSFNPFTTSECLSFLKHCPTLTKEMVQLYFHAHNPEKFLEKFNAFSQMDPLAEDTKKIFHIEKWANDGVSLSAPLAISCFQDWCKNNTLLKNQSFNIENITAPTVLINGTQDTIVPCDSSIPLKYRLQNCGYQSFDLGHVGLIVSKKAPNLSWKFMHHWIQSHYSI